MRTVLLVLILLGCKISWAQDTIPINSHSDKLHLLVGKKIWFTPNIGCLGKISSKSSNQQTERYTPEKQEAIEIKTLLYKDVIGYRFQILSESSFSGEVEANVVANQIERPPFNAQSYFRTCFFYLNPNKLLEKLKAQDEIGFGVYKGYSVEERKSEIQRQAEFDSFLAESIQRDIEKAKLPGVSLGMTKRQVLDKSSWGKPLDVRITIVKSAESEQWIYGDNQYLYFTNGRLTGIQK